MSKTDRIEPWKDFEATVRGFARHIWGVEGGPANIGGVDIDHVLKVNEELYILIEITVERDVNKAREDVIKLRTAKDFLFTQQHIFSRCFCVVDAATVTRAMIEAGAPYRINVLSSKQFKFLFFEYEKYEAARSRLQFGSAIDPTTGARDDSHYVKVTYTRIGYEKSLSIAEIADLLIGGNRIVLTGEYGSGKSRCVQELFKEFAARQENANRYPIAIDLRRNWGLDRHQEIIRRHFDDLGLPKLADGMLGALPSEAFIFLLDGFDEIGSQAWSTDSEKLRAIRAQSLLGVKDLVRAHTGAIFATGREHYFNNNEEMLAALGLDEGDVILLRSQEEFSTSELAEFLKRVSIPVAIPDWLPRRPLICKTIADLEPSDLERMFEEEGGDVEFWYHFIEVLCRRDAKTHISFDAQSIFRLLKTLARRTRVLAADVGPLSLSDIQTSFQEVVGQAPIEQASIMLQRLPGLGRVRAESDDRQFIDGYILDGLRAADLVQSITDFDTSLERLAWRNPLDQLGQRICASNILEKDLSKRGLTLAGRCAGSTNRVAASDIVASTIWAYRGFDYSGLELRDGHFISLDLSRGRVQNLHLKECIINHLTFPHEQPEKLTIQNCLVQHVYGIASRKGLPEWVSDCEFETFESIQNVSRIRLLGLTPSQEILVAIIRKTFFQRGAGRKEEALKRGLGELGRLGLSDRVLNCLITNEILSKFKGDEGWVFTPNRSQTSRMDKMMAELTLSKDAVWIAVSQLA